MKALLFICGFCEGMYLSSPDRSDLCTCKPTPHPPGWNNVRIEWKSGKHRQKWMCDLCQVRAAMGMEVVPSELLEEPRD